jgi:transposase, IS5 family
VRRRICGFIQHELPFDRSSLTRWRQRLGEEQIAALLQESLSVAHRSGAIESKDLERVVVDTTVQEKANAHPTDARLTHRAIEKLVALAKREGVELRQSYLRVAKRAAIMVGRYTHAHQFKRARRELKFLRTRLGRIIRDIRRKTEGDGALEDRFAPLLDLALRVRHQEQRQRGPKVPQCAVSMATRAIAATTIRTGSRSGSQARSAGSPRPSVARCAVAPPSSP